MKAKIYKYILNCPTCQQYKKTATKKYGKLPLKDNVSPDPFIDVHIDLVGPWTIKIKQDSNKEIAVQLQALTIMDAGTNLTEIVPYDNKTVTTIASIFDNVWLCRYPRPQRVIHITEENL